MSHGARANPLPGWRDRRLRDLGRAVGGGTPSRSRVEYWSGSIPWASVKDFSDDDVVLYDTSEHISREGLTSSASTLVPENTPIVCTRMAVGRCALTTQPTAINQDLKALLLSEEIDRRFLIRLLRHLGRELDRVSVGSTVRGVTLGDLLSVNLRYPTAKVEQTGIATVFDAMDEAITKAESVIAKLTQIRAGLLHDLLSRGLDENGELRDPARHPEQFMESSLGTIPKDWKIGSFRDFGPGDRPHLRTGPFGSSLKQEHWVPEGVPVVTIGSLGEGEFIRSEILYVAEETARILSAYSLLPGDIVFSRVADVGRSVLVTEAERGWIMSSNMMSISVDQRLAAPEYVQTSIAASQRVRAQIRRLVNTAGRDIANAAAMNALLLAWAPLDEQRRIVAVLDSAGGRLQSERVQLSKLHLVRAGLMGDLLSGHVRVAESFFGTEGTL